MAEPKLDNVDLEISGDKEQIAPQQSNASDANAAPQDSNPSDKQKEVIQDDEDDIEPRERYFSSDVIAAAEELKAIQQARAQAEAQVQPEAKKGTRLSHLGALASGVGKSLQSTVKKTITAASSAIKARTSSEDAMGDKKENASEDSLYRGSYQDMSALKWPAREKLVHNPGSIVRRQKRVLVTGGAGFIGSHLIDSLMNKGYDVLCADNLFSGQKCNIYNWFGHPNFEFIRHDVCNPLYVEVDEIYHLACPASPVFYQNNPIKTVKTCFVGTMYMLGLAKRVGARILLTSTSEVYGDPKVHPQTEEYWGNVNNIGIRSCYDEGKRIAETLMFEYHRLHNVNIAVARIFNTYGPRMLENDGRVVSNFIMQALRGEKLTIYGDGSQTRSFCYIDDQVRGLISLMESGQVGPINIGNPDEYTISELAKMTCKLVNQKMDKNHTGFVYQDLPSDDPKKRKPDITKAKKLLKWTPDIGLEQGLGATVDYFIDYLGIKEEVKNKTQEKDQQNDNEQTQ
eukprot:44648_1